LLDALFLPFALLASVKKLLESARSIWIPQRFSPLRRYPAFSASGLSQDADGHPGAQTMGAFTQDRPDAQNVFNSQHLLNFFIISSHLWITFISERDQGEMGAFFPVRLSRDI
jgi:hypothetical protein